MANRIQTMLKGHLVQDGERLRPCRPSDFCILLRSQKGKTQLYAAELNRVGCHVLGRHQRRVSCFPGGVGAAQPIATIDNLWLIFRCWPQCFLRYFPFSLMIWQVFAWNRLVHRSMWL